MAASHGNLKTVRLSTNPDREALSRLEIGNIVYLDGVVYTGREGVYTKVLEQGAKLPIDLPAVSAANFHCSPAAAVNPDGTFNLRAVTATASFRFSKWMAGWFEVAGARLIIGKGGMSGEDYRNLFVPNGAVYLTTVGYGTGALLGRGVKHVRDAIWIEELGIAQAMWVMEVENFGPFIVDSDLAGNSLFERENQRISQGLGRVYEGSKPAILKRYGETDDRSDELI
jgi:L(+)-tartrate dehydratase beta subunit